MHLWSSRRSVLGIGLLVLLGYTPLLIVLIVDRWQYPHYRFVPVLLAVAAALAWSRRDLPATRSGPAPWLALGLLIKAAALLGVGVLLFSPWFATVGLPLALVGLAVASGGRAALQRFGPVALLLACAIPLPMGWDQELISRLQGWTSRISSALLDLARVPHLMSGNVLEFPGKRLLVEEACSGVQSLFALVAATAAYLAWKRRPWLIAAVLLPAAVAAALVMNVARVTTIALAQHHLGLDLSTGWPHEVLGTLTFALALVVLAAVEAMAPCLLGPIPLPSQVRMDGGRIVGGPGTVLVPPRRPRAAQREFLVADAIGLRWNRWIAGLAPGSPTLAAAAVGSITAAESADLAGTPAARPQASGRRHRLAWVPLVLFGLVVLVQLPLIWNLVRWSLVGKREALAISRQVAAWDASTLPAELGGWKQVEFERVERELASDLGQHSSVWRFQGGGEQALLSCDYPFSGWHELSRCYRDQGWTIIDRQIVAGAEAAGSADPFVLVEMRKPTGESGLLCFALFDQWGRAEPIPDLNLAGIGGPAGRQDPLRILTGRIRKSWTRISQGQPLGDLVYQLQAFTTVAGAPPTGLRQQLQTQFVAMRQTLLQQLESHRPR